MPYSVSGGFGAHKSSHLNACNAFSIDEDTEAQSVTGSSRVQLSLPNMHSTLKNTLPEPRLIFTWF